MMIEILPSSRAVIVLAAEFATTADHLYRHFVDPDLLVRWWPRRIEHIEPRGDGAYHFVWPALRLHLMGYYVAAERAEVLSFSWQWQHDPDILRRHVHIGFGTLADGNAYVTLHHSAFGSDAHDQAYRKAHLNGWITVLGELNAVLQ